MRTGFAVLIAVVLLLGVLVFWVSSPGEGPSVTEAALTTSSTSTSTSTTTSTTATSATTSIPPTSSTTTAPDTTAGHVVETVEEAEEILRELWFGWFEGIYNQDEDRIREVVVLEETVDTARESFGSAFNRAPRLEDLTFAATEILRSDPYCLSVWADMELTGFREGTSGGVHVIRRIGDSWRRLSLWQFKDDLWEADCDSSLR